MGELMKTACKSVNGTAVAPLAQADGTQFAERKFGTAAFPLFSADAIRDTSNHDSETVDVSAYGLISLRIANTLKDANGNGVSITFQVRDDTLTTSFNIHYADGTSISQAIAYGYTVVLPDDIPLLNYISSLTLRAKASAVPTSGSLSISAVCKR